MKIRKLLGRLRRKILSRQRGMFHDRPGLPEHHRVAYLSFDTEWKSPDNLSDILDILRDKQVPAAFFLQGAGMERHEDLVRRILAEGHLAGNHTYSHPDLTTCDSEMIAEELRRCDAAYRKVTGKPLSRIMRPPYGCIDDTTRRIIRRQGWYVILWNVHTHDYIAHRPARWEDYVRSIETELKPGGIILQHSFSAETARYLPDYIDVCREKGYRFGSMEEFLPIGKRRNL